MNDRQRGWLLALLASSALLIVPLVVWFLLPNPGPPPKRTRTRPAVVATTTPEAVSAAPETPAPAPPPVRTTPKEQAPADDVIKGSVLDADGQPVNLATVSCNDRSPPLTTTTDAEGHFQLSTEAAGCSVVARHPQHPSSEPTRIEVGKDNVVHLGAGGTIEGVVVDDQNKPIKSFRLTIEVFLPKAEGTELGARGRPRQVNEDSGSFKLIRMPAGKYVLVASASGQPPGKSESVEVDTGQTTRNVRIVIPRSATLTGTIRDDETKRPVAGAVVQLDAVTGGGPGTSPPATTDEQGNYTLTGVPPGPFSVRVDHGSYKSRIVAGLTTSGRPAIHEDINIKPRGDGGSNSELEGIGAMLAPSSSGITIASVVEEGPAAKAGLQRGDRFVRIDGASAVEMTLSDVIQRLRGPEGSRVNVTLNREGEGTIDVTITRARIER